MVSQKDMFRATISVYPENLSKFQYEEVLVNWFKRRFLLENVATSWLWCFLQPQHLVPTYNFFFVLNSQQAELSEYAQFVCFMSWPQEFAATTMNQNYRKLSRGSQTDQKWGFERKSVFRPKIFCDKRYRNLKVLLLIRNLSDFC
jgi:hypothetical protein